MPQAIPAIAALALHAVEGVAWVNQLAQALTVVAASQAVDAVVKNNSKPREQGGLINLELNPSPPRRLVIGKRAIGGTLVDWYLGSTNNTKLYLPIYLSEGPCGTITKVWAGGRVVWSTPLVHGVRTAIPDFRSGGDRVWLTYYDGRVGQTADATLVALGQGWTSANKMTGCAYVVVELQWDSDNLRTPPAFVFEHEGAKLYDRRKDSTAGGSGLHRLTDPSTWELGDSEGANPMVSLDHFQLGRFWNGQRVFGIGMPSKFVPYDKFAAQANVCDENVAKKAGGTQKRYRANGVITANEAWDEIVKRHCTAMCAQPADFGGRVGVIGIEARTPVMDISDDEVVDMASEVYIPKRTFGNLVGVVRGKYQEPEQVYQPVPYAEVNDPAWDAQDAAEPREFNFDLDFETNSERAERLATLKAKYERRQATLTGVYPYNTIELERGDWFVRSGAAGSRFGVTGKTFEVMERIFDPETFTVTINAQEVDPADSAWNESLAADPPPAPLSSTATLSAIQVPAITVTAQSITGTVSSVPALKIAWTAPTDPRVRFLYVEVENTDGTTPKTTKTVAIPSDANFAIVTEGIADGEEYGISAKFLSDTLQSDWCIAAIVYSSGAFAVGAASSVPWSGVTGAGKPEDNATVGGTFGVNILETAGGATALLNAFKTILGQAATITSQGAFATVNTAAYGSGLLTGFGSLAALAFATLGTNLRRADGTTIVTDALAITSLGQAATIAGQGAFATVNTAAYGSGLLTGFGSLAALAFTTFGTNVRRADGTTVVTDALAITSLGQAATIAGQGGLATLGFTNFGTNVRRADGTTVVTDALAITSLGQAATIASQGALATLSSLANGGAFLTGFGALSSLAFTTFGTNVRQSDGTTIVTDALAITSLGQAATIAGQGALATLAQVNLGVSGRVYRDDGTTRLTDAIAVTSLGQAATIASQGALATLGQVNLGVSGRVYRDDGTTRLTDAIAVTSLGQAATIASQGAFATVNTAAYGSGLLTGFGGLAALAFATFGTNVRRADGTTIVTDALAITSLGQAATIAGQDWGATAAQSAADNNYINTPGANCARYTQLEGGGTLGWIVTNGSFGGAPAVSRKTSGVSTTQKPGLNFNNTSGTNGQIYYGSIGADPAVASYLMPVKSGERVQVAARLLEITGSATGILVRAVQFSNALAAVGELSPVDGTATPNTRTTVGRAGCFATASQDGFIGVYFYITKLSATTAAGGLTIDEMFISKARAGQLELDPYTPGQGAQAGADVTSANQAATITGQGALATLAQVNLGVSGRVYRDDGTTRLTDAIAVTSLGQAATIASQGALATLNQTNLGASGRVYRDDGTTRLTDALAVTSLGQAATIAGQGALATKATIDSTALMGSQVVAFTALTTTAVRLGTNITRADGTTSVTDATAITSLGQAATIASQGAFATVNTAAYGSGLLTGFGGLAALAFTTLGTNVRRADGTTAVTDATAITSLGQAATIASQGDLATTNRATLAFGENALTNTEFSVSTSYPPLGWTAGGIGNLAGVTQSASIVTAGPRRAVKSIMSGTVASGTYFDLFYGHYNDVANARRYQLPVVAGDVVGASALVAKNAGVTGVYVNIQWLDSTGVYVGESAGNQVTATTNGDTGNPADYGLSSVVATAPANSRFANLFIRCLPSIGAVNATGWGMSPMLCRLPAGQTVVPSYTPGGVDRNADITSANQAATIAGQGWGATASEAQSRASYDGLTLNPKFDAPFSGAAVPPLWSDWIYGSTATFIAKPIGYGNCIQLNGGASQETGFVQNVPVTGSQDYLLTGEIRRQSGTLAGTGIHCAFYNVSNALVGSYNITFATEATTAGITSSTPDGIQRWEKVVAAPAGATYALIYAMSHWGGHGDIANANSIAWYECSLEPMSLVRQLRADVTSGNQAASFVGQAALASLSFVQLSSNVRLADGTTIATNALLVTSQGQAATIVGQGALATKNQAAAGDINVTSLSSITATIGTLRTATSGARVEIKDNIVEVYDATRLRVRLGIWT